MWGEKVKENVEQKIERRKLMRIFSRRSEGES